jgi:type II secretory pathway pseudopilin PulG
MRTSRRAEAGFTLIEIGVVLLIIILLTSGIAGVATALAEQRRVETTRAALTKIDAALVQYVSLQRRLPCPADGLTTAGVEGPRNAAGCTAQTNGVVPWQALGLTRVDVLDGWDTQITYRVGNNLTLDGVMDFSWCDPAGTQPVGSYANACSATCTNAALANCTPPAFHLNNRGLEVRDLAGNVLMNPAVTPHTGAAYVLISHGTSKGGGYSLEATLHASSTTDGTEEQKNYANLPLQTYYVDNTIVEAGGAGHFDDLLVRPSVLTVANRAGLGPRAHN